jgi:hypothetical protein
MRLLNSRANFRNCDRNWQQLDELRFYCDEVKMRSPEWMTWGCDRLLIPSQLFQQHLPRLNLRSVIAVRAIAFCLMSAIAH